MLEKLKTNIGYAISAFLGLFTFIFMAMPYFTLSFYEASASASGYDFFSVDTGIGFIAILMLLTVILALVMAVVMLAYGVIGLLSGLGIVALPESVTKFVPQKRVKLLLRVNMIITIVFFIWILLDVIGYADSYYDAAPGVGIWLALIFSIAGVIANKILSNKFGTSSAPAASKDSYACTSCGAKAKPDDKFCSACGGKVEKVVKAEYACTSCGASAKEGDKFCSACGGQIAKKTPEEATEEADSTEEATASANTETAQGTCPVCYSSIPEGTNVCPMCGSAVK